MDNMDDTVKIVEVAEARGYIRGANDALALAEKTTSLSQENGQAKA